MCYEHWAIEEIADKIKPSKDNEIDTIWMVFTVSNIEMDLLKKNM